MFDFSGFWSEEFGSSGFHRYCPCELPAWGGGNPLKPSSWDPGASGTPSWFSVTAGAGGFYCCGLLGADVFFTAVGWWVLLLGLVGLIAGAGGSLLLGAGGSLLLWAGGFILLRAGGFLLLWAGGF